MSYTRVFILQFFVSFLLVISNGMAGSLSSEKEITPNGSINSSYSEDEVADNDKNVVGNEFNTDRECIICLDSTCMRSTGTKHMFCFMGGDARHICKECWETFNENGECVLRCGEESEHVYMDCDCASELKHSKKHSNNNNNNNDVRLAQEKDDSDDDSVEILPNNNNNNVRFAQEEDDSDDDSVEILPSNNNNNSQSNNEMWRCDRCGFDNHRLLSYCEACNFYRLSGQGESLYDNNSGRVELPSDNGYNNCMVCKNCNYQTDGRRCPFCGYDNQQISHRRLTQWECILCGCWNPMSSGRCERIDCGYEKSIFSSISSGVLNSIDDIF